MRQDLQHAPKRNEIDQPGCEAAGESLFSSTDSSEKIKRKKREHANVKGLDCPGAFYEDGGCCEHQQRQQARANDERCAAPGWSGGAVHSGLLGNGCRGHCGYFMLHRRRSGRLRAVLLLEECTIFGPESGSAPVLNRDMPRSNLFHAAHRLTVSAKADVAQKIDCKESAGQKDKYRGEGGQFCFTFSVGDEMSIALSGAGTGGDRDFIGDVYGDVAHLFRLADTEAANAERGRGFCGGLFMIVRQRDEIICKCEKDFFGGWRPPAIVWTRMRGEFTHCTPLGRGIS